MDRIGWGADGHERKHFCVDSHSAKYVIGCSDSPNFRFDLEEQWEPMSEDELRDFYKIDEWENARNGQ